MTSLALVLPAGGRAHVVSASTSAAESGDGGPFAQVLENVELADGAMAAEGMTFNQDEGAAGENPDAGEASADTTEGSGDLMLQQGAAGPDVDGHFPAAIADEALREEVAAEEDTAPSAASQKTPGETLALAELSDPELAAEQTDPALRAAAGAGDERNQYAAIDVQAGTVDPVATAALSQLSDGESSPLVQPVRPQAARAVHAASAGAADGEVAGARPATLPNNPLHTALPNGLQFAAAETKGATNASAASAELASTAQPTHGQQPFSALTKEAVLRAATMAMPESLAEASQGRPTIDILTPNSVVPESVRGLAATLNSSSLHAPKGSVPDKPVPLTGTALAVEIVSRMREGMRRFDIRLDPPELGRVDVRLDVDRQGQVKTLLTVERAETLELLQREARGLERALQQAGLKTDEGGLEFALRQQAQEDAADKRSQQASSPQPDYLAEDETEPGWGPAERYSLAAQARGGIDIRI